MVDCRTSEQLSKQLRVAEARIAELSSMVDDLRDTVRLLVGRKDHIAYYGVPESIVDAYLMDTQRLKEARR